MLTMDNTTYQRIHLPPSPSLLLFSLLLPNLQTYYPSRAAALIYSILPRVTKIRVEVSRLRTISTHLYATRID